MKKILMIVAVFLLFGSILTFITKSENDKKLMCDENGDFTILIVSDPQCDTTKQWNEACDELEILVKRSNADYVLINGDMNSYGEIPKDMWNLFISPLTKRNIYWSTTNGNHDPFSYKHYKMFKEYDYCLNSIVSTTDSNYDSSRPMNYMLPIYSKDGKKIVFAVYGMDSGTKNNNGYEGVTKKQIEWYKKQSESLKTSNDGKCVTSVLCMHIPLPQMLEMYYSNEYTIYGVANEVKWNVNGYTTKKGKKIDKINVHTSGIELDNKIFDAFLNQGDIKAVFFGHNHRNNFVGSFKGILLGFAGKLSTGCYSDTLCRGGRVIRFNQDEPYNFTTEWLSSIDSKYDQAEIYSNGKLVK